VKLALHEVDDHLVHHFGEDLQSEVGFEGGRVADSHQRVTDKAEAALEVVLVNVYTIKR